MFKCEMLQNSHNIYSWKHNDAKSYWNSNEVSDNYKNIANGIYCNLEQHIQDHGFILDLEECVTKSGKTIFGNGIELASGVMWLTSYLVKKYHDTIHRFYSLEYSEKLINLGKLLLDHYQTPMDKVTICLGSFYEIKLPAENLDFIVMCQAFHHAEDPNKLLQEAYRVLKKGGVLIMISELFISKKVYLRCYVNYIASLLVASRYFPSSLFNKSKLIQRLGSKNLLGSFQELYFPPDLQTGDHYYLQSQFEDFFIKNHFTFMKVKSHLPNRLSYVLFKQ